MKTQVLKGLGTALITPFTSTGEIDFSALARLVERQVEGGVAYLVVLGTTAETATMTDTEKEKVMQFIVDKVNGRIPLVLGVGGNCTKRVVEELTLKKTYLKEHFAAILSVCPYYNKPTQEGLFQHFRQIVEASTVPVLLYNVPGRTGVNMLPETVVRLYESFPDKIAGIKEASGNFEQIVTLIDMAQQRFLVISGDDGYAVELMNAGADGLISVAANAWPNDWVEIVEKKSMALQQYYAHIVHLLFVEGNPAGIKTVLHQMNLIENILRLPLVPNSQEVQMIISRALKIMK